MTTNLKTNPHSPLSPPPPPHHHHHYHHHHQYLEIIHSTRRLLDFGLFLHQLGKFLATWFPAIAIIILILKISGFHRQLSPSWLLLTVIPFIFISLFLTYQKAYSNLETAAWLDLNGQCGGFFLSLASQPFGHDKTVFTPPMDCSIPPNTPRARLTFLPFFKKLTFPLLFFSACLIVPPAQTRVSISPQAILQRAHIIKSRIQTAQQLNLLDKRKALQLQDEIRRSLDQIEKNPQASIEAIDHIQNKLDHDVFKTVQDRLDAVENVGQLNAAASWLGPSHEKESLLAKTLENTLPHLPPFSHLPPSLQKKLEKFYNQRQNSNLPASQWLPEMLKQMDRQTLKQLANFIQENNLAALQNAQKYCNSGCVNNAKINQSIKQMTQASSTHDAMTAFEKSLNSTSSSLPSAPFQGTAQRGRADAPLVLAGESIIPNLQFKPGFLKPGKLPIPGVLISNQKIDSQFIPPEEFLPSHRRHTGSPLHTTAGLFINKNLSPFHLRVTENYFQNYFKVKPGLNPEKK